jgi:hypothetical protein
MTPLQTYDSMTDQQLIDFVAAKMPAILWRIEKKPRCGICRPSIIEELGRNPLFRAIEEEQPR